MLCLSEVYWNTGRGVTRINTHQLLVEIDLDHGLYCISNMYQLEELHQWSHARCFFVFCRFVCRHLLGCSSSHQCEISQKRNGMNRIQKKMMKVFSGTRIEGLTNQQLNTITVILTHLAKPFLKCSSPSAPSIRMKISSMVSRTRWP